jgi:hypothetical protein
MNDDQLRKVFAELRRVEMADAPPYVKPARSPLKGGRLRYAAAFALMLVVVIILSRQHETKPRVSISEWRAQTDFLLQTPGHELLNSVPDLKGNIQ